MPKPGLEWPVAYDFADPEGIAQVVQEQMRAKFVLLPKSRVRGKTSLIRHAVDLAVEGASVSARELPESADGHAASSSAAQRPGVAEAEDVDPFGHGRLPM